MILPIRKNPDPVLREKAKPVPAEDLNTPRILKLAKDMVQTMIDGKGVGLAAPQVGVSERVIIVSPPGEDAIAIVNPEIIKRSIGSMSSEEGCLSVPGTWGFVRRAKAVTVKGFLPDGQPFRRNARDYEATIYQHEIDHLNGVLFIDKAKDVTKVGIVPKI